MQHAWETRREQLANEAQPDLFSSILASFWWAITTISTVGYGDIYPITPIGKLLSAITAVLGIGLFALPAGIFGAGLIEAMDGKKGVSERCPHCKREIPGETSVAEGRN